MYSQEQYTANQKQTRKATISSQISKEGNVSFSDEYLLFGKTEINVDCFYLTKHLKYVNLIILMKELGKYSDKTILSVSIHS